MRERTNGSPGVGGAGLKGVRLGAELHELHLLLLSLSGALFSFPCTPRHGSRSSGKQKRGRKETNSTGGGARETGDAVGVGGN